MKTFLFFIALLPSAFSDVQGKYYNFEFGIINYKLEFKLIIGNAKGIMPSRHRRRYF
jgi:hypothetical protein